MTTSSGQAEGIEKRESAEREARHSRIIKARERLESDSTSAVEGYERLELALVESTRTEANLGLLLRGLAHLTAGITSAREANASLLGELDAVRELLDRSHEQESALRHRVRLLERSVDTTRREAALERARLLDQEDAFLVELLDDHERELRALRDELEQLRETDRPGPDPEASREQVRVQTIPSPRPASALETPRVSVGAVKLQTVRIPRPAPREPSPGETKPQSVAPPSAREIFDVAPGADNAVSARAADVANALAGPARDSTPPPGSVEVSPALPISERPSARYSLTAADVAEERVDTSRVTILPPSERVRE